MFRLPLSRNLAALSAVIAGLGYTAYSTRTNAANVQAAPIPTIPSSSSRPLAAIAVLLPDNNSGVSGVIRFSQSSLNNPCLIEGEIRGLSDGLHGFHIHEFGNLTQGCTTAGAHYNPFNKNHGNISDSDRHVGDMGNVNSKGGVAVVKVVDQQKLIGLSGETSVIGRSVVVHADPDDLGKGGFSDSKTTGHAGGRKACGVIGVDKV